MQMTIEVPSELAELLKPLQNRLPELLERAARDLLREQESDTAADETVILEMLATTPRPEELLALHPSPALQARASELLAASKEGTLSRRGEVELERILLLERLVRMAKANAYKQLGEAL